MRSRTNDTVSVRAMHAHAATLIETHLEIQDHGHKCRAGVLIGILLFAAGNGIMWPSFLSMISKSAESKYQGAVQGFASSSGSLASIIGLITGGILFGVLGPNTFILPAVIMVLIFLASFRLHKIANN